MLLARINGKYIGSIATKNPDYASVKFACLEYFKGTVVNVVDSNLTLTLKADDAVRLGQFLKPGETYNLDCGIQGKPPRDKYPASVEYKLHKIFSTSGQQIYPPASGG